ncbi:histone-lysine N-methyltransferase SETMAR [Trichonephila clavipes]|nr:histone-lysine N-methyltransferase SETMAR [Trichonephila clavipes]
MEVSEQLGITQSVISRLWQRLQDNGNVSRRYNTDHPRVTTPKEDRVSQLLQKEAHRVEYPICLGASGSKSVSDNRGTVKCSYNQPWLTIQEHLQQIGKTNRAGVWVPHNLSEENRANRSTTCNLLLQRYNTEPFFDRLITADEKWVLYDNPKRKRQWLSPKEPLRRAAKPGLHPKKALLCVWWGIHGIVHFEVLKPGKIVNADLYCQQLDRLNQS